MTKYPAVEMCGITRRFPGVLANDRVDFTACSGELHALIGENGAGKTTLMSVLYGMHRPDSGEIRISGQQVNTRSPRDAISRGIGMVHQHFMLVPAFTVLENIILGAEPVRLGRTDYARAESAVRDLCERFQLDVDPGARVGDISISAQQKTEILKSLYRNARILILDEPASVLAPGEAASLFAMLRRFVAEGMCVILISHKLSDVMAYSDRVTVMRAGRSVACVKTEETSPDELTRLMVGHESPASCPRSSAPVEIREPVLRVRDLSARNAAGVRAVDSIAFDLHSGEILGVAGVDGNGQRELADVLVGLRSAGGSAVLDGQELLRMTVRRRLDAGVAYVPEDLRFAILPDYSIRENVVLGSHRHIEFARLGVLDLNAAQRRASDLMESFDIRATGASMLSGLLSGGNRQQLVLGRALSGDPKLLIASQPTRGLDIVAGAEVHRRLLEARNRGTGILLISHDLDEILALSDRVMVMYRGRIAGILSCEEANRERVGALMLGAPA